MEPQQFGIIDRAHEPVNIPDEDDTQQPFGCPGQHDRLSPLRSHKADRHAEYVNVPRSEGAIISSGVDLVDRQWKTMIT